MVTSPTVVVLAQDGAQDPIYVPFDYEAGEPVSATILGSSGGTTTYGLIDGPRTLRPTPGPATLLKSGNSASMIYVNEAIPSATYSGVCNLVTPVALCTLNVQQTGAALPPSSGNTGGSGGGGNGGGSGRPGGTGGAVGATGGLTALIVGVTTAVVGFGMGVKLLN
ncbi:hypothetical protein CVT24_002652 [Panaeolus cyanescens]|uniref:Uncharacterized protein n=1 Tax=Panaeolus cyanescens TaxID=181874 RepID=A0A409YYH0_9AGAR|nr:hypothetical protein CVT24_002652 [Panaeolus cyanescens]